MSMLPKTLKVLPVCLLVLIALAPTAQAQSATDVVYTWTPPTTGSPVHHYLVEHSVNGGPFVQIGTTPNNTYTLAATIGDTHQIRVVGVDALDRIGEYSEASDPYSPELGPPGQPGKPIIIP